jgi:anti-anti-sigma regulatory factor
MLKIERSRGDKVVLSLSGRIEADDVAELQQLLSLETAGQDVSLDLREVTLVDRDAVTFLARCEAERVKLTNCPAYIREWIDQGKDQNGRSKR